MFLERPEADSLSQSQTGNTSQRKFLQEDTTIVKIIIAINSRTSFDV